MITLMMREILNSIRSITNAKNKIEPLEVFLGHLDKLLKFCEIDDLCGLVALIFRGHIENMPSQNFNENLIEIEKQLYSTKKLLQSLVHLVDTVSSQTYEQDKLTFHQNTPV